MLSWVEDLRRASVAVAKKKARSPSVRTSLFYILHWAEDGRHFGSNTNVVEVSIKRLRAKMDTPFEIPLLHTVRGMGYVLELRE